MKKGLLTIVIMMLGAAVFAYENNISLGLVYGFLNTAETLKVGSSKEESSFQLPTLRFQYNGFVTDRFGFNVKFELANNLFRSFGSSINTMFIPIAFGPSARYSIGNMMLMMDLDFFFGFQNQEIDGYNPAVYHVAVGGGFGLAAMVPVSGMLSLKMGIDMLFGTYVGDVKVTTGNTSVLTPTGDIYESSFIFNAVPYISACIKF